ncbi:MAG TPA: ABC transporter ATP-binding protein [Fibrobacteraceae bacterium]|nr:ABC transporter ATP-binding protein [Fibrobacteraceae bacterium]
MIKVFRLLRPSRRLLALALLALLVAETCPFIYPLLLQRILDGGAIHGSTQDFWRWILAYAALVMVHSVFLFGRTFTGQRLSIDVTYHLRLRLFHHLQRLPLRFLQQTPVGSTMTRLSSDVDAFGTLFSEGFLEIVGSILLLFLSVGVMLSMDWRLGLATLVFFPALFGISAWFRARFRSLQTRFRNELASLNAFLQETLNGVVIIQTFSRLSWMQQLFQIRNQAFRKVTLSYARHYAGFFPLIQSLSDLSLVTCYAAALWLIGRGQLSVGTLVAFAWFASIYSRPLRDLSDRINTLQTALAAGDRTAEFLAQPEEATPQGGVQIHPHSDIPALSFREVYFAYPEGSSVLHGLSFDLAPRESVALTGTTGCGKSTTLQLALRFLVPQQGRIQIFGEDLSRIDVDSLRAQVAWLGQDPFLFPASIADNICLGHPYETSRFSEVCRRAQLEPWLVTLPEGVDTLVGTGGRGLSSGQRQLIAYARALYQDPAILLLDEPSASLDASTEHALQLALRELLVGRAALIVSHRPASITACDREMHLPEGV